MFKFLSKSQKIIFIFNLILITLASIFFIQIGNQEFLFYISVMVFFFILIAKTLPKTKFSNLTLILLSTWGFLHLAGGGVQINSQPLYNLILIPISEKLQILKFDQFVHAFGFGTMTLVCYELLQPQTKRITSSLYLLTVMAACGFGALNEIVEFTATLLTTNTNVGDYTNTSLDLVFNLIGAIITISLIHLSKDKINPKLNLLKQLPKNNE